MKVEPAADLPCLEQPPPLLDCNHSKAQHEVGRGTTDNFCVKTALQSRTFRARACCIPTFRPVPGMHTARHQESAKPLTALDVSKDTMHLPARPQIAARCLLLRAPPSPPLVTFRPSIGFLRDSHRF